MDKIAQLIAGALSRTRMASEIANRKAPTKCAAARGALNLAAIDIAATMAQENPAFDRAAFICACGF